MGSRKKVYEKKSFESDCSRSDVSANIYQSMILSEAWKDLTPRQQSLYLLMKLQYYAQKKHPDNDQTKFTFNQLKWRDIYELYSDANKKAFYKDRDALTNHGLIVCTYSGKSQQRKNEYQYSDQWKQWRKQSQTVVHVIPAAPLNR